MKKLVVLISGKLKSGKNVCSDIMLKELREFKNLDVIQEAFANEVKENSAIDFELLEKSLNNYVNDFEKILKDNGCWNIAVSEKLKELNISYDNWFEKKTFITRNLLQIYGTEIFRRRVDNNYWVKVLKDKCIKSHADVILISDARFPNELEEMYDDSYNLVSIRLTRESSKSTHDSETALDNYKNFSYIIENNDNTVEEFEEQVKMVLNDIKEIYFNNDSLIESIMHNAEIIKSKTDKGVGDWVILSEKEKERLINKWKDEKISDNCDLDKMAIIIESQEQKST